MPHHPNSWVLVYTQHATVGSMKKGKIIGFNAAKMAEQMMANAVAEQNRRLVEYAEAKIRDLGDMIASYPAGHHMNDKGNLLDSLCWGVCYDGKMIGSGFYREQTAASPTIMHARFREAEFKVPMPAKRGNRSVRSKWRYDEYDKYNWENADVGEPVNGHQLAAGYLAKAHSKCKANQWMVFFAICAPYWGYWEEGFNMRIGKRSKFVQFSVMTQFYDSLNADLKPMKVRKPHIHVEKYASKSLLSSAKKNFKDSKRLKELI